MGLEHNYWQDLIQVKTNQTGSQETHFSEDRLVISKAALSFSINSLNCETSIIQINIVSKHA